MQKETEYASSMAKVWVEQLKNEKTPKRLRAKSKNEVAMKKAINNK